MCGPEMAIAQFAFAGLQTISSHMGRQQQHEIGEAMARRETEAYHENVKAAQAANREEHIQLHHREIQERDTLQERNRAAAVEGSKAVARQAASTGESNVTGISVDNLLLDIERGPANDAVQREASYMNTVQQLRTEMKAADKRAEARINSKKPGYNPVQAPSGLDLVAGIGGAGVSSYGTYERLDYYRKPKAKADNSSRDS